MKERLIRRSRPVPSAISASTESAMRSLVMSQKTIDLHERGSARCLRALSKNGGKALCTRA